MNSVLVFGSINLDLSMRVPRLPRPGETVLGAGPAATPGGKGANQAHAARLYGAPVRLVGAVGHDAFADDALRALEHVGVQLGGVRRMHGHSTGLACIGVDPQGENLIMVAPGANAAVRADWVDDGLLAHGPLLLLQNEVALVHALPLMDRCRAAGGRVMLNLAPVAGAEQLRHGMLDWLVVNAHELAALCGSLGLAPQGPAAVAAAAVAAAWDCTVVVTLGAAGVLACKPSGACMRLAAPVVQVVDTTGAGDTFCGTFAAALAMGAEEPGALLAATAAASLSCLAQGAQGAQPSRHRTDQAVALLAGTPAPP